MMMNAPRRGPSVTEAGPDPQALGLSADTSVALYSGRP